MLTNRWYSSRTVHFLNRLAAAVQFGRVPERPPRAVRRQASGARRRLAAFRRVVLRQAVDPVADDLCCSLPAKTPIIRTIPEIWGGKTLVGFPGEPDWAEERRATLAIERSA